MSSNLGDLFSKIRTREFLTRSKRPGIHILEKWGFFRKIGGWEETAAVKALTGGSEPQANSKTSGVRREEEGGK
jgi:hypothetical protein